jgi:hypothetical protein
MSVFKLVYILFNQIAWDNFWGGSKPAFLNIFNLEEPLK